MIEGGIFRTIVGIPDSGHLDKSTPKQLTGEVRRPDGIANWRDTRLNVVRKEFCLTHNVMRHIFYMIKSFRCKETERIFQREYSRRLPTDIQKTAFRKLRMLNRSSSVEDLRVPPGNRLEALSGRREGQHSIRINEQWRICFVWRNGGAHDVEIVDYHKG